MFVKRKRKENKKKDKTLQQTHREKTPAHTSPPTEKTTFFTRASTPLSNGSNGRKAQQICYKFTQIYKFKDG
jgi:hypothetical protein